MSIKSMTGFARLRNSMGGVEVEISIKTVNHRGLDIHFSMPPAFDSFEAVLRSAVKRHIHRGHIEIRLHAAPVGPAETGLFDFKKLDAYFAAFRAASAKYGLTADPDLNAALTIPGMLVETPATAAPSDIEAPLLDLAERALALLNEFRTREGGELATIMLERNVSISRALQRIEELRLQAAQALQQRLRERLTALLGSVQLDPQRLVQEAALLADRSDIGEEVSRLRIHSSQVQEILAAGSEAGKKLDFLLQEMNREANTILSKTAGLGESGLAITELALSVKTDIEKIREQCFNLE